MRIRKSFAGAFLVTFLASAYLGLAPISLPTSNYYQSDKGLHFITFFVLSLCFYWILEANRRRTLQLTLIVCTLVLGIGSEVLQALLPNDRKFDPYDVVANILGSVAAIGLCTWYHRRMLERKRRAKSYSAVPGEDEDLDLELGEHMGAQESGVEDGGRNADDNENWETSEWDNEEEATGGQTDGGADTATDASEGPAGPVKQRDD